MAERHDTHTSVPDEKLVYASSNGDTWYLCIDPMKAQPAVKHIANPQSGGHISYLDVESFLLRGAGPEHQALRELIRGYRSATFLIAYDCHLREEGTPYRELADAIQSLGAWWHHLETVWIVRSEKTPEEIRDRLAAYIGADDQLLVADITSAATEWAGINEAGSNWLRANINHVVLSD